MRREPRGPLRAVPRSVRTGSGPASAGTASPSPGATSAAESVEAIELDLLIEAARRRHGVELTSGAPLAGVVRELAESCGGITRSGLIERLLHDAWFAARALPALAAAGGCLFDDPTFYRVFVQRVIPWLRTWPYTSIWAPQCAQSGTVLSMAILLEEAGLGERCRIYATDDDAEQLQRAGQGTVARECLAASEANYRRVGCAPTLAAHLVECDGAYAARPEISRSIVWSHYSVDVGRTFNEFNMIVGRRLSTERSPERCRRIARLIDESLSPLGLLAVSPDQTDRIAGYLGERYREWDRAAGLLQRAA